MIAAAIALLLSAFGNAFAAMLWNSGGWPNLCVRTGLLVTAVGAVFMAAKV